MKKSLPFIAVSAALCGCASNVCYNGSMCIPNEDNAKLIEKGYRTEEIERIVNGKHGRYYCTFSAGYLESNYICDFAAVEKAANAIKQEKEEARRKEEEAARQKEEEEKERKLEAEKKAAAAKAAEAKAEAEKRALEKKYGVKWCDGSSGQSLLETKGCMDYFGGEIVESNGIRETWATFQQANDGTLIKFKVSGGLLNFDTCCLRKHDMECQVYFLDMLDYCEPVFVEKNPTDSNVIDGRAIKKGLFSNTGTYRYTTTIGSAKTVVKLKRLQ